MTGVGAGGVLAIACVVGLVCGVINVSIAQRKGLSAGGYFALGLFLGLIGVLVAAVAPAAVPRGAGGVAGWYGDPWLPGGFRWYDGQQWTGHTQPPAG